MFFAPKYSENNFSSKTTIMSESKKIIYSPQTTTISEWVQYVFFATEIPPCVRSPRQPTSHQYHIHQVLSHPSVQTINSEIAYTVSNSRSLGKEIMCRTLPWKENVHVTNHYDFLIIDMRFPANSFLSMLEFTIAQYRNEHVLKDCFLLQIWLKLHWSNVLFYYWLY